MSLQNDLKYQGYSNFSSGVSSSIHSDLLPDGYSKWARNIRFRGARPTTRPGFVLIGTLPTGRFQGASYFSPDTGSLITAIDGRYYSHKLSGNSLDTLDITPRTIITTTSLDYVQPAVGDSVSITVGSTADMITGGGLQIGDNQYYIVSITSATQVSAMNIGNTDADAAGVTTTAGASVSYIDVNSSKINQNYMVEANKYLVIQDGSSKAIIYDGSTATRAADNQIPVGTCMAYGNGRLWVANKNNVYAGDIAGLSPTSHFYFTETDYIAEGGSFTVHENVEAMAFLPRLDDTTETGDLYVFTKNTTTAIKATVYDRTTWKDTAGMMKILFPSIGAEGQRTLANANQDIVSRSKDGWRSVRNTYIDLKDFSNIPISIDAIEVTRYDSDYFLKYNSSILFDNRLLMTANNRYQYYSQAFSNREEGFNIVSDKILSLDLAPIAYAGSSKTPSWDGEWTGLNVMQFVKGRFNGNERLLAISCDSDGVNRVYEITKDRYADYNDANVDIPCRIDLKSATFEGVNNKKILKGAKLFFSDIRGSVDWSLKYYPDEYQCYQDWTSGNMCATSEQCDPIDCIPVLYKRGYKYPAQTNEPPAVCNTFDAPKLFNNGWKFDVRVEWTGRARLDMAILSAQQVEDSSVNVTCSSEQATCNSISCCDEDSYLLAEN